MMVDNVGNSVGRKGNKGNSVENKKGRESISDNMKTYDFTSKKPKYGRVVFALTLNQKHMTERIIIGRVDEVRRLLNGGDGDIYYDEVRPLGSLLIDFEGDKDGEWNRRISVMMDSYKKIFPRESARWKEVAPVSEFLTDKYKNGEPSAMFTAICTWEYYLHYFNQNNGAKSLSDRLFMLYKPFMVYSEYKPWQKEAVSALSTALRDGESQVELWYPVSKRPFETVVTFSSFLPIIFYYTHKIEEWKLVFQQCKVCNKYFVAKSRHYELCSDKCRKLKSAEAKREFDERAKDDNLEKIHESAYQYWYNRWRKLKAGKAANPDAAATFKVRLDVFRKEAKERKKLVKLGQMRFADFSSWLAQQQNKADRLMDELAPRAD